MYGWKNIVKICVVLFKQHHQIVVQNISHTQLLEAEFGLDNWKPISYIWAGYPSNVKIILKMNSPKNSSPWVYLGPVFFIVRASSIET